MAVVTVFTALLMLITFEYEDIDSLTAWSFNFWDLFFKGKLDEFYAYTAQNIRGAAHKNCGGNYLWLLPICIWNLPMWVADYMGGTFHTISILNICWTKLFLLLLQAVTAYVSGKICAVLTSERDKVILTILLVMASPEIMISVGYAGQDEIVYVSFFLICLYCFMKGYWKRCYLLMVCCVTFCPVMLIPVLAVLMIREKRIVRLVLYIAGTVLPLLVFEMIYKNDAIYQEVKQINAFDGFMAEMLRGSVLSTSWGELSIAGIVLCLIYFFCYFGQLSHEKHTYNKTIIYIMALIFVVISFLMVNDFYRMFLYVPFLVIAVMASEQDMGMNLCLLTAISYGRVFQAIGNNYPKSMNTIYIMKNSWITALCDYLGRQKYLDSFDNSVCLWSYMIRLGDLLDVICLIMTTCVMAAVIILFAVNGYHDTRKYAVRNCKGVILSAYILCMPFVMICYYYMLLH